MPYVIEERPTDSSHFYVFKQGQDGKAVGDALNKKPYPSKAKAEPYLRALYAAMKRKEKGNQVSELDLTILTPDGLGLEPILPQASVDYTETSPFPNKSCERCVFFAADGFCYLVASYPLQIRAEGYCDAFEELTMIADPTGVMQMSTQEAIHEMAKDLPIASGDPKWDAGEAKQRIWAWATDKDGNFDVAKAAQAFLIRDGDNKGDLKDPIADVVNGHLEVIPAALRAAASRLPQTEGSKGNAAVVLAYYKKKAGIGDEADDKKKNTPTKELTEDGERAALDDFVISEYKGSVPDVPDAPGIDKKALTEGDPKPTFVIRPIAQVGRTSKNGILYDQALIDSIREQINTNHPMGIFGHIKDEDRATAHPTPQAYWIGAKQYGDKLYAKAYIADMERAADIRRKKALNSADGTSIYGTGSKIRAADGSSLMRNFTLESLDFAPVDRASLDMGREMYITSEMQVEPSTPVMPDPDGDGDTTFFDPYASNETNKDNPMSLKEALDALHEQAQSMTPDDLCVQMTQTLGEQMGKVMESYLAKNKQKAVAMEMEAVSPTVIAEMQQQTLTIKELQAFKVLAERREFDQALIAEIAKVTPYSGADEKMQKATLETRGYLELKARMALGDTLDASKIAETISTAINSSPAIMEMWRDTLAGPKVVSVIENARLDATKQASERYYDKRFDVNDPKYQDEARARMGV